MSRYIYGEADELFVKVADEESTTKQTDAYKFRLNGYLQPREKFDRNEVSIVFKSTPDLLLNLSINVIDTIPLPSIYEWTTDDVCKWVKRIGYPHFQDCFRVNLINGRTLLLVDASALSAMNIKNWVDIKRISYCIRSLFYFEMVKFCRSISLPPENYYELYKLFRVNTGTKYADTRRTDLYIRMHILHEKRPHLTHWGILERWCAQIPDTTWIFGGERRHDLYKCKSKKPEPEKKSLPCKECDCMPPCECVWTERDFREPWRLKCLPQSKKVHKGITINPMVQLTSTDYIYDSLVCPTLTVLKKAYPQKYDLRDHNKIHILSFSATQSFSRHAKRPTPFVPIKQSTPPAPTTPSKPSKHTKPYAPPAHTTRSTPSTHTTRSKPPTQTIRSTPVSNTIRSTPATHTIRFTPPTPAMRSTPATHTLRFTPSTPATRFTPSTRTIRSKPSTKRTIHFG